MYLSIVLLFSFFDTSNVTMYSNMHLCGSVVLDVSAVALVFFFRNCRFLSKTQIQSFYRGSVQLHHDVVLSTRTSSYSWAAMRLSNQSVLVRPGFLFIRWRTVGTVAVSSSQPSHQERILKLIKAHQ